MDKVKANKLVLEARLGRNAQQWIEGGMTDNDFFRKMNTIHNLVNNKFAMKEIDFTKIFDSDGAYIIDPARPIVEFMKPRLVDVVLKAARE